jgi:hypothetical protein
MNNSKSDKGNKDKEIQNFLSKENVEMIWDIILDDGELMKNKTQEQANNISESFISDIRDFFRDEKGIHKSLINMNKKFISNIINKYTYTNKKVLQQELRKELRKELQPGLRVTAEDIQATRMSDFEKQFQQKQTEFSSAMTMQVPDKPKFNDEADHPISEMEDLIARTLAQRNFDIDQIHQNLDREKGEGFLKSQETSLKSEKNVSKSSINSNTYNKGQNEVKYIKIGSEDLPQLAETIELGIDHYGKKNVSWANDRVRPDDNGRRLEEENIKISIDTSEKPNIFSRLKMKPEPGVSLSPFENTISDNLKNDKLDRIFDKINFNIDLISSKLDLIMNIISNPNVISS